MLRTEVIQAGEIVGWQRWASTRGLVLVRAKPFRDQDGRDCFVVMYVEGKGDGILC